MTQYPKPMKNNNKMMITILIILCVLAVAALIGLVWVVASGNDSDDKKTAQEYVSVFDPETGKELKVPEADVDEYIDGGYVLDLETVKDKSEDDPEDEHVSEDEFGDSIVLYRPDGTTLEVSADEKQQYLDREGDEKYYEEEVIYIYNVDGDKEIIKTAEAEEYLMSKTVNEDGEEVEIDPVERWYKHPVVIMYSTGDRRVVISAEEDYVEQYKEAGWFEEPVAAITKDGESKVVLKSELEPFIEDGWEEYNPKLDPCEHCGKQTHTTEEHPRCEYCDSLEHVGSAHPECAYCGVKTTHVTKGHPCSRCRGKGHDASDCTVKICSICGTHGHEAREHTCTKCGGKGHDASTCTVKKCAICGAQGHIAGEHACTKCGGKGHDASTCTVKKCTICGAQGHIAGEHACTKCGGKGHDASTCTVKKCTICGALGHIAGEHTCTKCGGKGHDASTCTVKKCTICGAQGHDASGHRCTVCGGVGHGESGCIYCHYCGSRAHDDIGHPRCSFCGGTDHTTTCDYCCTQSHTSEYHPSCSWCGRKDHSGKEHDAVIAAEAAAN